MKYSSFLDAIRQRDFSDFMSRIHCPYGERINEGNGIEYPAMPDTRRTEELFLSYGVQGVHGGLMVPCSIDKAIAIVSHREQTTQYTHAPQI